MAKYGHTIEYHLQTKVDQSGITQMINSLKKVQIEAERAMNSKGRSNAGKKQLDETIKTAKDLQVIMNKAFDVELGVFSVKRFNKSLGDADLTIGKIERDLLKTGAAGRRAFDDMVYNTVKVDKGIKTINSGLDKMWNTLGNTVRWGITASLFQGFTSNVRESFQYVKELDTSLNNIRIVTEKSASEMERFARVANKTAKEVGSSTKAYSDAALIYYQQGLNDEDSQKRADITVRAANVTGQAAEDVSNQLTAVWNGYKVATDEAELYVDKLAAVAAATASDLEEQATAMSKVASAASVMGVDIDQLNSIIATTVSVTKQAPESIGVAYKTIFARLGDLRVDGIDEFGVELGPIAKDLQVMGIELLDTNGQMRDMGIIMTEVGEKWDGWTRSQRQAAAVAMAGKRQYNNLIALFDNWDMYTEQVENSANAMGTLTEQNDIYLDSTAAKLAQLSTTGERISKAFWDVDSINGTVEGLTSVGTGIANLVEGLDGGIGMLKLFGAVALQVFSSQIGNAIAGMIRNMRLYKESVASAEAAQYLVAKGFAKEENITDETGRFSARNEGAQRMLGLAKEVLPVYKNLSEIQKEEYNTLLLQTKQLYEQKAVLIDRMKIGAKAYNAFAPANKMQLETVANEDKTKSLTGDIDIDKSGGKEAVLAKIERITSAAREAARGVRAVDEAWNTDNVVVQAEKVVSALDKVAKAGERAGASNQIKPLEESLAEIRKLQDKDTSKFSTEKLVDHQNELSEAIITGDARLAAYNNTMKKTEEELAPVARELSVTTTEASNNSKAIERLKQSYDALTTSIKSANVVQNLVQIASGLGQISFAISSIGNIGDIWNNEDLSDGEKYLQIITALGFALPALYSGLLSAGTAAKALRASLAAVRANIVATSVASIAAGKSVGGMAIAVKALGAAFSGNFLGIALVALTAIAGVWLTVEKNLKQARERQIQQYNEENDSLGKLNESLEQYKTLMAQTDSMAKIEGLTSTTKSLNDELKDQELLLYSLSQDWEKYQERLEEVSEEQLRTSNAMAGAAIENSIKNADKLKNAFLKNINIEAEAAGILEFKYKGLIEKRTFAQGFAIKTPNSVEDQYEQYKQLGQILKDVQEGRDYALLRWSQKDDEVFQAIEERHLEYEKIFSGSNAIINKSLSNANQEFQLERGDLRLDSAEDYNKVVDELIDKYQRMRINAPTRLLTDTAEGFVKAAFATKTLNQELANNDNLLSKIKTGYKATEIVPITQQELRDIEEEVGGAQELAMIVDILMTTDSEVTLNDIRNFKKENKVIKVTVIIRGEQAEADLNTIQTALDNMRNGKDFSDQELQLKDLEDRYSFLKDLTRGTEDYQKALANLIPTLLAEAIAGKQAADDQLAVEDLKAQALEHTLALQQDVVNKNNAVRQSIDAVKEAEKTFGKGSIEAIAARNALTVAQNEAKEAIERYQASLYATTLQQQGFTKAASLAAGAILAQGKAASTIKHLDSLLAGLNATATGYASVAAAAYAAGVAMTRTESNTTGGEAAHRGNIASDIQSFKETLIEGLKIDLTAPKIPTTGVPKKGGSKNKPGDKMHYIESEFDRYYKINKQIKLLTDNFKKLAEAQSKLSGPALIKNLNAQVSSIKEQIKAQKEKLRLQEKERKELVRGLKKKGAKFDEEGTIKNYEALILKAEARVNAEIRKQRKSKTKKDQKKAEKKVKAQERILQTLKDSISDYDKLFYEEMESSREALREFQDQIVELRIQKFTIQIETAVDLSDVKRSFNEFYANLHKQGRELKPLQSLNVALKDLSTYLNNTETGTINTLTKGLTEINREIAKMKSGKTSDLYGKDMATALAARTEMMNNLMTATSEYNQLLQQARDLSLEWASETISKFGEITEKFEYLNKSLEYQSQLITLLYGDKAYSQMDGYFAAQKISNEAQTKATQAQLSSLLAARKKISKDDNPELWEEFTKAIKEAQSSIDDLTKASLENLVAQYKNSVEGIIDGFTKGLTGGMNLGDLENEWKLVTASSERYLDATTRTYQINKLQGKYVEAINNAAGADAQARLNKLKEIELDYLRKKGELTQYDVDRANMLYEIELKKIALEEAQSRKSTMRLKRDAQGNYSYVYAADKKEVEKARQDLADAQQGLHELNKSAFAKNQADFLTAFKELQDKAREIFTDPANAGLTSAEKEAKARKYLEEGIASLISQNDTIKKNYEALGEDVLAQSPIQKIIDAISEKGLTSTLDTFFGELKDTSDDFGASVSRLPLPDVTNMTAQATSAAKELTLANRDLITSINAESSALAEKLYYLQRIADLNSNALAYAGSAVSTAVRSQTSQAGATAAVGDSSADFLSYTNPGTPYPDYNPGSAGSLNIPGVGDSGDAPTSSTASSRITRALSAARSAVGDPYIWGAAGPNQFDCSGLVSWVLNKAGFNYGRMTTATIPDKLKSGRGKDITVGWKPGHTGIQVDGGWYEAPHKGATVRGPGKAKSTWDRYYHIPGYDTGGYTGKWGDPGGRLAVLHEKEIVLNKADTVNLLAAVIAIRDMAKNMRLGALTTASGLASTLGNLLGGLKSGDGNFQQEVTIHAEFPNVTNALEIERALINLPNKASQHVNKSGKN